jgi:hypothetical protein
MSDIDDAVQYIFATSKAARDRGALSIWTVYDHPKDFPDTFVARRYEAGGGGKSANTATADAVVGDLALIREAMTRCGLYRMQRAPVDPREIVETWL